ncbi:MAG TPA: CdaR family protein, partial [Phototrophicaceae bacterium]|nr:CdaR family protein [Phototrophicaceae bacterium]
MEPSLRRVILTNLMWFLASLALAFVVWLVATAQSDPFVEWRLTDNVPIHIAPDSGLIITNQGEFPTSASVQLQAPRSVESVLAPEDVIVSADLSGLGPGEHTVPLQAKVAREASVVAITPSQITITLEVQESQLKPVSVNIVSSPPVVYSAGTPALDVHQVEVSGPASLVGQVNEVVASVSLDNQRTPYADDIRVTPVDVDGHVVSGVTLDPQTVHVSIDIEQRSDVREVRVQPNIVGELAEGYVLTASFDYDPKTIVVSGPAEVLNNLPGTISTAPISLSDKTSSFQITVPVELPDPRLVIVTGRTVTVTVGISTQTITRQFDHIAVEFAGGKTGLNYHTVTNEVTVLVTGPQPLLNQLTASDLSVLVDVSGLNAGDSAQLAPVASILDSSAVVTTSVLPAQIDVEAQ